MRNMDKFTGCLVGGAIGDALGYPVEFLSYPEIIRQYGKTGITRYVLKGGKALISDDTQMTLFTATGMLYGQTRSTLRGLPVSPSFYIYCAYRQWLATQVESYPWTPDGCKISWLINLPELYAAREPGHTCISALYSNVQGSIEKPINNSKGCGGIMRVAPIGLFFVGKEHPTLSEIDQLGAEAAALTHGHELGYIPAAALVHIVYLLASGTETDLKAAVLDAIRAMQELFPDAKHMPEFLAVMEKAILLSQQDMEDAAAIAQIGEGWVAEETLAIAVYCALKYPHEFEKAIVAAVNHSGDSDSTGAVAGNILGAYLGLDALPDFYCENLELYDVICEIAADLHHGGPKDDWGEQLDPVWESKYIQVDYGMQ